MTTRRVRGVARIFAAGRGEGVSDVTRVSVTGAATDGSVTLFFLKEIWRLFSPLESDDLFSWRLLTTPIFPRRLSRVLSKFSRKKIILFGCNTLDGVTRGGPPPSPPP